MSENKKPMSKAKKEFIASIIILVAGVLFIVTGSIMIGVPVGNRLLDIIFGSIIIACGAAMIGIGIFLLIKNKRLMNIEKTAHQ